MSNEGNVIVKQEETVLVLTMNNPSKRNAIFADLYHSLKDELNKAKDNPNIGAIILRGAEGYFCSGGDLKAIGERRHLSREERRERLEGLHDLIRLFRSYPKPIIAAIEGGAAGAGVSIAFACDLLIVDQAAKFSVAYVKVGLTPDGGVTGTLGAQLPKALLMELCLTGSLITAERLYQLGAINKIVAKDNVYNEALVLATQLGNGPATALTNIKELCQKSGLISFEEQLDLEAEYMILSQENEESKEGITAFFEKRKADFVKIRK